MVFPRLFVKYGGKISADMRASDQSRGSPVYVYDGIEETDSRRKLQNVHYFTQKQKGSSEDLWLEVAQYIYDVYDIDCLETIYIMGDGAGWIKQGLVWLPKSIFVLGNLCFDRVRRATKGIFCQIPQKPQGIPGRYFRGF